MQQTVPAKFKFITNEYWNPADNDEQTEDGHIETPDHFWQAIRNFGWDEFRCGKSTHVLGGRLNTKLQRDMFIKYYNRHMREFMAARARIVPDRDECLMIGSHFIALGKDHFTNAMNDDELIKNVHTAAAYGDFNGSLPQEYRYVHVPMRPNAAN